MTFALAATAARNARLPECAQVPSPILTKTCFSSVKGAMPSQDAPSPPIWVKAVLLRSGILVTSQWQPMPAMPREPSGTRVLVLCGQPGQ